MKSTTLHLDSMPPLSLESSHVKGFAIESLLVVGVSAFWVITLPLVAAALIVVKVWDCLLLRPRSRLFLRPRLGASRAIIYIKVGGQILDLRSLRIKSRCWGWP